MSNAIISAKYLYDIAEAIRVKLGTQELMTLSEMPALIGEITGALSGTITRSASTERYIIDTKRLTAISNAIQLQLSEARKYTPAQMADAILSIEGTPIVPEASWASGTDEEVAAIIDAAHDGLIDLQEDLGWAVGDVRTIQVGAFTGSGNVAHATQYADIVITSFDEYMGCGNVLQFDFKNGLAETQKMNATSTNVGGYAASEMKTVTLPAMVQAMPAWMQSRLIEFSVNAGVGGSSSAIETVTGNKLALRAETEVVSQKSHGPGSGEGSQLAYYATSANRIKTKGKGGSKEMWWMRSPNSSNSIRFVAITRSGGSDWYDANSNVVCLAPFGCL